MKSLIMLFILPLLASYAMAATLHESSPGEEPVSSVLMVEKDGKVTFTYTINTTLDFRNRKINSVSIATRKGDDTDFHDPIIKKNPKSWTFSFTVNKDQIDKTAISMDYLQPVGKSGLHLTVVWLELGPEFEYWVKNQK